MWKEDEHPRAEDGKFTNGSGEYRQNTGYSEILKGGSSNEGEDKKMTPAEKIASVHIDFDRDNILPELNESELEKIGNKKSKPVLLKKRIIDRNRIEHGDLTDDDFEQIIVKALYSPSEVFPANKDKPYFHFAKVMEVTSKSKPKIGLALLDVDDNKINFEIVHAYFVEVPRFVKMREKEKKKD